jgi:hypothetical protein
MNNSLGKNPKQHMRAIEHDAFYQGAHNIKADHGLAEIQAVFNQRRAQAEKATLDRTKPLEAQVEYLTQRTPEVERRWREMHERYPEQEPHVVGPILYVVAGLLAVVAEAVMLAPSLDLLNVVNPTEQRIVAFVIGAVAAVLFHFAWETFQTNHFSRSRMLISRLAGLGALIALVFLGVLRGQQNAFAAELNGNPLGQFLHNNPILATGFFIFITVACPLAAAFALTVSLKDIYEWQEYQTAKREGREVPANLIQARKELEAENEKLQKDLAVLEEQRKEWSSAYRTHHERGATIGAKQSPQWLVWLKAISTAAVTAFLCGLFFGSSTVWWLLPLAVLLATYVSYRRIRIHPTPEQYFALQNVQFRIGETETGEEVWAPTSQRPNASVSPQPAPAEISQPILNRGD